MTYILGHVIILESNVTPECSFHVIVNVVRSGSSFDSLEGLSLRLDGGSILNILLHF